MDGKSGGSGTYSFHERSNKNRSVMVAHMPDDGFNVRIVFRHNGETLGPGVWLLSESEAEMLWAALNSMSKDLNWEDFK